MVKHGSHARPVSDQHSNPVSARAIVSRNQYIKCLQDTDTAARGKQTFKLFVPYYQKAKKLNYRAYHCEDNNTMLCCTHLAKSSLPLRIHLCTYTACAQSSMQALGILAVRTFANLIARHENAVCCCCAQSPGAPTREQSPDAALLGNFHQTPHSALALDSRTLCLHFRFCDIERSGYSSCSSPSKGTAECVDSQGVHINACCRMWNVCVTVQPAS